LKIYSSIFTVYFILRQVLSTTSTKERGEELFTLFQIDELPCPIERRDLKAPQLVIGHSSLPCAATVFAFSKLYGRIRNRSYAFRKHIEITVLYVRAVITLS